MLTNCPIREHTGDDAYVGRCEFGLTNGEWCPRHGLITMYKNNDDRDVAVSRRFHDPLGRPEQRQHIWGTIAVSLAMRAQFKYAWQARKFSRMPDPPREWPEDHPLYVPKRKAPPCNPS